MGDTCGYSLRLTMQISDLKTEGFVNTVTPLKIPTKATYVIRDSGMLRRFHENAISRSLSKASNAVKEFLGLEPETLANEGELVVDPDGPKQTVLEDQGQATPVKNSSGDGPPLVKMMNPLGNKTRPPENAPMVKTNSTTGYFEVTREINAGLTLLSSLARLLLAVELRVITKTAREKELDLLNKFYGEISALEFDSLGTCIGIVLNYEKFYEAGIGVWYNVRSDGSSWVFGKDRLEVASKLKSIIYGPTLKAKDPLEPAMISYRVIEHYPKSLENSVQSNWGDRYR